MKLENEMTDEVRQLLDSLEEHGKNARRQKDLEALIDGLSEKEAGARQRKLYPIWWALGAAAAVLLLWLMIKPTTKKTPNMNDEILVEGTIPMDSLKTEVKNEVKEVNLEQPIIEEVLLADETQLEPTRLQPVITQKPNIKTERPKKIIVEKAEEIIGQEKLLAEATSSELAEKIDTSNIGSNTISPVSETPSTVQKPQRRVIRSLNLVCYECQTENGEWEVENGKWKVENSQLSTFNFPLSTQAQDPNMKNGAMTFELKLN